MTCEKLLVSASGPGRVIATLRGWLRFLKRRFGWLIALVGGAGSLFFGFDEVILGGKTLERTKSWAVALWLEFTSPHTAPWYFFLAILIGFLVLLVAMCVAAIFGFEAHKREVRKLKSSFKRDKDDHLKQLEEFERRLAQKDDDHEKEIAVLHEHFKSEQARHDKEVASLQAELHTDDLTQVPNRRQLVEIFQRHRQLLPRRPFCLAYVDIVGFRAINDRVHHERADTILKQFAKKVKGELRGDDELFRLHGDQFVVIYDNAYLDGAERASKRINDVLIRTPFNAGTRFDTRESMRINVLCRFGITDGAAEDELDDCLRRADAALNHAKRHDRSAGRESTAIHTLSRIDARTHPELLSDSFRRPENE